MSLSSGEEVSSKCCAHPTRASWSPFLLNGEASPSPVARGAPEGVGTTIPSPCARSSCADGVRRSELFFGRGVRSQKVSGTKKRRSKKSKATIIATTLNLNQYMTERGLAADYSPKYP